MNSDQTMAPFQPSQFDAPPTPGNWWLFENLDFVKANVALVFGYYFGSRSRTPSE